MGYGKKINPLYSNYLLDLNRSPVARFRLMSQGVNTNTRLVGSDETAGDCACLACGNCVDACPVVRHNVGMVFQQNLRTSMSLENFVQEECRRCYRCVNSCPQVGKELKEYTQGYRRVEKIVHLLAAATIILLAATGVTRSHYGNLLDPLEADALKYIHRTLGVLSVIIPIIYYKMDISHFRRAIGKIFSWGEDDSAWIKGAFSHVFSKKKVAVTRHEFNPAQKLWYLFIISFFPLLYLSGWGAMLTGGRGAGEPSVTLRLVHMAFALSFDIMLFTHVYVKFIREWARNGIRLFRNYKETGSLVFKGSGAP